jgi:hypothetical protein
MSGFETRFGVEADADRVRDAFYRFLQLHSGAAVDGDAHIRTGFDGHGRTLLVRLWSAEAMEAFLGRLGFEKPGLRRRNA